MHLTVEPRTARPGGTVTLVLHNATSEQLGFNLCRSALERLQGGVWVRVPEDGVCTLQLNIIGPGQEARYQRTLPGRIAPGDYRFNTRVEAPLNAGPQRSLPSEVFRIVG